MSQALARFVTSGGAALAVSRESLHEHRADALIVACGPVLSPLCSASQSVWAAAGAAVAVSGQDWVVRYGPVPPGNAIWIGAGGLRVKGLILAVLADSPTPDPDLVAQALRDALRLAAQTRCVRLAVPLLGAHVASPTQLAELSAALLRAAYEFLEDHPVESIEEIRFVSADQIEISTMNNEFLTLFGAETRIKPSLEVKS